MASEVFHLGRINVIFTALRSQMSKYIYIFPMRIKFFSIYFSFCSCHQQNDNKNTKAKFDVSV